MKRLLVLDLFRGVDSTGVAVVRNTGEVHVAKTPSHPLDLFDMGRFKSALNGTNSKVFMGHNRHATRGGVTTGNAHPFEVDHITGMHNGTLDYQSTKRLEEALDEKFTVDSHALIAAIAKFGIKTAIEMCTEGKDSTDGAWSLVWYDAMEGSLNFLRNKHRPLWYGYSKDFKQFYWASEWPMIEAAIRLGGTYELYTDDKYHRFWQTNEDIHYRFDVDIIKAGGKKPKPTVKEIKGREPKPVVSTISSDPFKRTSGSSGRTIEEIKAEHAKRLEERRRTGNTGGTISESLPKTLHLNGDIHNPLAGYITRPQFEDMAKYGCSWCQADLDYSEAGVLIFERDGIIICPQCVYESKEEKERGSKIFTKLDLYM